MEKKEHEEGLTKDVSAARSEKSCGKKDFHDPDFDLIRCGSSSVAILDDISLQYISSVRMHISDGPWALTSIESLIAGFSVVHELQTPPIAERSE